MCSFSNGCVLGKWRPRARDWVRLYAVPVVFIYLWKFRMTRANWFGLIVCLPTVIALVWWSALYVPERKSDEPKEILYFVLLLLPVIVGSCRLGQWFSGQSCGHGLQQLVRNLDGDGYYMCRDCLTVTTKR